MHINVHAHVFNFRSVMTKEAVRIFISRLKGQNLPAYLTGPLQEVLNTALTGDAPGLVSGNQALKHLFSRIAAHKDFKALAGKDLGKELSKRIEEIPFIAPGSDALQVLGLVFKAVIAAGSPTAEQDAAEKTVADFLDFIRIGFLPSINDVTDDLVNEIGPRDIVVALPMDIISEDASQADLALYPKQLADTVAQALRRPGRILPFVKVNTMRAGYYKLLKEAVESGSCVGVKLYPSLGYAVDSPEMKKVLAFCNDTSTPVLLHCNQGGFRRSVADAALCDPAAWRPLMQELADLKVCFGHFGGDENLVKGVIPASSWTRTIINMMSEFPGRVYADIAYHTALMEGKVQAQNYRKHLDNLLKQPATKKQLLWGTDYHLVRQHIRDRNYIRYFSNLLGDVLMKQIAVANPTAFLGLPDTDTAIGPNMERHAKYLLQHKDKISGPPASWLAKWSKTGAPQLFTALEPASWEPNNSAHWYLYKLLTQESLWKVDKFPRYLLPSTWTDLHGKYKGEAHFDAVGAIQVGELTIHTTTPGNDAIAKLDSRKFVKDLIKLAGSQMTLKPAQGYTSGTAFKHVHAVTEKKEKEVAHIATAFSEAYRLS